jgi:transcriptional regulator with XRE-family HTH domain
MAAKSPIHDKRARLSRKGDDALLLGETIRSARLRAHLTQDALAEKADVFQRVISNLERATINPRVSTVQNVARALDLELMLVPRHLVAVVEGLQRGANSANEPMYVLSDDEDEESDGEDHPAKDTR